MSGGTRCNLTHHCEVRPLLEAFAGQGRFLKHAVHNLTPAQVVREVNRLGVPTKVEDSGKVFPVSNRAIDVRDALLRRMHAAGAEIRTGVSVLDVARTGTAPATSPERLWRVRVAEAELLAERVLLCCGGLSYAGCGTTGDGYAWAKQAGHTLVATAPALTPLVSPTQWVHGLQGVTLADAAARVLVDGQRLKDPRTISRGGFLWTHFGCSGPVPMNVSRFVSVLDRPQVARLHVDLVPSVPEAEIDAALRVQGPRRVANLLQSWVPRSLAQTLTQLAGIEHELPLAQLPKKARLSLVGNLKHLHVPLSGTRGYPKAEVTRGGIDTREVNPRTMESRLAPGLFLAGEILDIDGPIGGYNFQAAFSTGHAAGLQL